MFASALHRLSSARLSQASCSGNQTEDTAYASVSSLGSEDTSQEKVLSDASPLSTMTGRSTLGVHYLVAATSRSVRVSVWVAEWVRLQSTAD